MCFVSYDSFKLPQDGGSVNNVNLSKQLIRKLITGWDMRDLKYLIGNKVSDTIIVNC